MLKMINRFHNGEKGAALAEYSMLVGLIAVVSLASVQFFGREVSRAFVRITTLLEAGLPGA